MFIRFLSLLMIVSVMPVFMFSRAVYAEQPKPPILSLNKKTQPIMLNAGSLLVVWSWGRNTPSAKRAIAIMNNKAVNYRIMADAFDARWLSANQIIAFNRANNSGYAVKVTWNGKFTDSLMGDFNLIFPRISQSAHAISGVNVYSQGGDTLEIRKLSPSFEKLAEFRPHGSQDSIGAGIWKEDDSLLATSIWKYNKKVSWSEPVLAILSADLKNITYPFGETLEKQGEPGGIDPLFWQGDSIYGISHRGFLRCDIKKGVTQLLYTPREGLVVLRGVLAGDGTAVLALRDLKADPFEVRIKELHEVRLSDGRARVLFRAADNEFIDNIDWIKD
jgi:hypothetical protein